jgi:hypothetical protein
MKSSWSERRVENALDSGRTEIVYGPDWFTSTVTLTLAGKQTISRSSAKWVGATCKGDEED